MTSGVVSCRGLPRKRPPRSFHLTLSIIPMSASIRLQAFEDDTAPVGMDVETGDPHVVGRSEERDLFQRPRLLTGGRNPPEHALEIGPALDEQQIAACCPTCTR